jgi:hypothetical protein
MNPNCLPKNHVSKKRLGEKITHFCRIEIKKIAGTKTSVCSFIRFAGVDFLKHLGIKLVDKT